MFILSSSRNSCDANYFQHNNQYTICTLRVMTMHDTCQKNTGETEKEADKGSYRFSKFSCLRIVSVFTLRCFQQTNLGIGFCFPVWILLSDSYKVSHVDCWRTYPFSRKYYWLISWNCSVCLTWPWSISHMVPVIFNQCDWS